MARFADRFLQLASARSPLCLGLDPSAALLRAWGIADNAEGLRHFCEVVFEAAADRVAVVKLQSAFFERHGPAGVAEMARAIRSIRERGALSLVDCKRGDVIDTMEGYADSMLGEDSGFCGDAMTVTAYLGFEALRPAFDRALACGTAVFVVVHSSNADGRSVQDARRADGKTVAEALADDVTSFNAAVGLEVGPLGAVVGATIDSAHTRILSHLSRSLILAPGVGAQGATIADVGRKFAQVIDRTLPSASRSILHHGPSSAGIRDAIDRHRDEAWLALERRGSVVAS